MFNEKRAAESIQEAVIQSSSSLDEHGTLVCETMLLAWLVAKGLRPTAFVSCIIAPQLLRDLRLLQIVSPCPALSRGNAHFLIRNVPENWSLWKKATKAIFFSEADKNIGDVSGHICPRQPSKGQRHVSATFLAEPQNQLWTALGWKKQFLFTEVCLEDLTDHLKKEQQQRARDYSKALRCLGWWCFVEFDS